MTEAEWIAFLQRPEIPAFNRAMLDNPEDDLPRLVFADWMDENCPDTAVNAAVRESINGDLKYVAWPNLRGNRKWSLSFVRGRVMAWVDVEVRPPQRRPARIILESAWQSGWVEAVLFGDVRGHTIEGWVYDPPMRNVSTVGLPGGELLGVTLIRWLSPELMPRLIRLEVRGPYSDAGLVRELAASPHMARIEILSLPACPIVDDDAIALARSPHVANLKQLNLDVLDFTPAGAAALANSPYLCEAIRAQWRR